LNSSRGRGTVGGSTTGRVERETSITREALDTAKNKTEGEKQGRRSRVMATGKMYEAQAVSIKKTNRGGKREGQQTRDWVVQIGPRGQNV